MGIARSASMKLNVGTSGYSYKGWKGSFYPERIPAKEMLGFYASRLLAVEINNTFYRMPKVSVLETWASQVPADFRFAIKASRRITHFKRLKEVGDEIGYLLQTTRALGDRLGVLLFQLPPNLSFDLPRLAAFLELLPTGTPAAFEFRHPSWSDVAVHELLRGRNCALVGVDSEDVDSPELVATARWGYLRLRRSEYDRADLADWVQRVRSQGWEEVFVFFKHEADGPRLAAEFVEIAEGALPRKVPALAHTAAGRKTG